MAGTDTDPPLMLAGQHIAVLIPAYDGKIPVSTMLSLFGFAQLVQMNGGTMSVLHQSGMALVTTARNMLLSSFMAHEQFTAALLLDADIIFEPMDALKLVAFSSDWDITCGLYRAKTDAVTAYFVSWEEDAVGKPKMDPSGVMLCRRVPLGFAYVKRDVLARLWDDAADKPMVQGPFTTRLVFDCHYDTEAKTYIGEDYFFCDKARAAGFRICAIPEINLGHLGAKSFSGPFKDYLDSVVMGTAGVIDDGRVNF
jgi:hypothetical protein